MNYHEFKNKDLERFFNYADYVFDQYDTNLIMPYGLAFSRAHTTFEAALNDQKKSDAFVADLLFVGLVVLAGVATAGLGTAPAAAAAGGTSTVVVKGFLGNSARNAAAKAPSSSLIMKVFRQTGTAMSAAYNSTTGKRLFTKLWPEVKSKLKLAGKNSLTQGMDSTAGGRPPNNALEAMTTLRMEIKQCFNVARTYAIIVDQQTDLSDAEKSAIAAQLTGSPALVTAPARVAEDELEKNLLLSFFMTFLLASDYTQSVSWNPYGGSHPTGPKKSVDIMPSDPKYPGSLRGRQIVAISERGIIKQPGSKIRKAVDKAYNDLFCEQFFENGWAEPDLDYAHMLKAETALESVVTF